MAKIRAMRKNHHKKEGHKKSHHKKIRKHHKKSNKMNGYLEHKY
jgi:hypothetical protein